MPALFHSVPESFVPPLDDPPDEDDDELDELDDEDDDPSPGPATDGGLPLVLPELWSPDELGGGSVPDSDDPGSPKRPESLAPPHAENSASDETAERQATNRCAFMVRED